LAAGRLAGGGSLRLGLEEFDGDLLDEPRVRTKPNTRSTRSASHQAISASRANPESARSRMRVLGQRVQTWPTIRATSSTAPALPSYGVRLIGSPAQRLQPAARFPSPF
jgi:hypothetical protein